MDKTNTLEKNWAVRILIGVMSISIAMSSWFLSECWNKISILENKVQSIEIACATVSSNRFTSGDWLTQKTLMDVDKIAAEKRIIRLEESIPVIKDSMLRIEIALKEHSEKDRNPK
jgi:hypothetical protein